MSAYRAVPLIAATRTSTDVHAWVAGDESAVWPVPDWLATATRALGGASVGEPSVLSIDSRVAPVNPVRPALKSIETRSLEGGGPLAIVTGAETALSGPRLTPSDACTCHVC
jgi:hypothetical protein